MNEADQLARSIEFVFHSPNEADSNLEPANVVDGLFALARAVRSLGTGTATDQGGAEILCNALHSCGNCIEAGLTDLAESVRSLAEAMENPK